MDLVGKKGVEPLKSKDLESFRFANLRTSPEENCSGRAMIPYGLTPHGF